MNNLVSVESGVIVVSSVDVSDKFGKIHRDVMRSIKKLATSTGDFGMRNFAHTSYTTSQNKTHECYNMTRDGFALLAMGFTGNEALEWKIKYINAFNSMESALLNTAPTLETVNQIVKRAESDKQIASECGSQLSKYKRIKAKNDSDLSAAIRSVQLALGFDR